MTPRIGILALQGGYADHAAVLQQLGWSWRYVLSPAELESCDALILPGGESTAQSRLARHNGLDLCLPQFAAGHPIFGTCAGLILMGDSGVEDILSLRVLDVQMRRNAYGRQCDSCSVPIQIELADQASIRFPALFIRAPQISVAGPKVTILAHWQQHPVLVAQGPHFGMSFHPELTQDTRLHSAWLERAFGGYQAHAVY